MQKVALWLASVVGFLAIATVFERTDWDSVFHRVANAVKANSTDPPADPPAPDPPQEKVQDNGRSYFPPDTPSTLYEYTMALNAFPRAKELTMIIRVDGTRTISGKSYFKEITEFTGWEDLLEKLKSPEAAEEISKSGELKSAVDAMEEGFKQSVTYARWDKVGELDLDGDDLTVPETRGSFLNADVGTEWSAKGLHAKAVSIEDVMIGDKTFPDCLRVRVSGTQDGMTVQGAMIYAARGIGMIKIVIPNLYTATLKKYRR